MILMPSHDDYSDKSMPMFSEGSSESGELGVLLVDGSHLLVGSRSSHDHDDHHHPHHHHQDSDCDGTDHKLTLRSSR